MPSAIAKRVLSGSTNGKGIKVAATATLGTTIHAAVSGTSDVDEIWLYAYNSDTADRLLTIEFGGATDPDNVMKITLPAKTGYVPVVKGLILQNSLSVTAFCDSANKVTLTGFVNRLTA